MVKDQSEILGNQYKTPDKDLYNDNMLTANNISNSFLSYRKHYNNDNNNLAQVHQAQYGDFRVNK